MLLICTTDIFIFLEKLAGKITTSKQLIVSSWLYALTHSTEMATFWCTIYSISHLFSPLSWVLSYLSWFSLQPPGYTIKQSFNICSNLTVGFGQEERSRLPENRQWIIKTYFIQEQWNCFHCRIIPTLHNGTWRPWERATDYLWWCCVGNYIAMHWSLYANWQLN